MQPGLCSGSHVGGSVEVVRECGIKIKIKIKKMGGVLSPTPGGLEGG